ncbi:MAG: hypothetical protein E7376_01745 [Clostridiales bacterium]|nr:hypothetical protein [Clostridiales bacterium]
MKKNIKWLINVATICLCLCAIAIGVYAAKQASLTATGTIGFTATNVYAEVSGQTSGAAEEVTFNKITIDSTKTGNSYTDTTTWSGKNIEFDEEGTPITLTFTITNLATDREVYAKVTSTSSITNVNMSINGTEGALNSGWLTLGANTQGATNYTTEIVIVLSVANTDISVSGNYAFNLELNSKKPATMADLVKYDTTNNYYYIVMGEYGDNEVRWRYISDVTSGIDSATKFTPSSTNKPNTTTGAKGMFILETVTNSMKYATAPYSDGAPGKPPQYNHTTEGYTDLTITDYGTSDVRSYLNNETNILGNDVGTIFETLGIDASNEVYANIQARPMTDFYDAVPSQFEGEEDKFWILSKSEAETFLNNDLPWYGTTGGTTHNIYWLRTPLSAHWMWYVAICPGGSEVVIDDCMYYYIQDTLNVRPTFILNF